MLDNTQLHIGNDPQLFVDSWLIECTQGLTRRWHKPVRTESGPLISKDRPWEKTLYFTYSTYCVIRDPEDGLIKCWYEDLGPIDGTGHPRQTRLLYAESEDGVEFRKPELDNCIIDGRRTNIVVGYEGREKPTTGNPWANAGVQSCGLVIDPNAATAEERFRAIFTKYVFEDGAFTDERQTVCAHSRDGVRWSPYETRPTMGSSGNSLGDVSVLHYDAEARQFVQNTRHSRMGTTGRPATTPVAGGWFGPHYPYRPDLVNKRRVYQSHSSDFLNWTNPVPVSIPDDDGVDNLDTGHYGMQQFRVGRLHFGTLGVFRYVDNEMDVRLMCSRDGVQFRSTDCGQPFLAPRGEGFWDAHMVSMTSQPVEMGDE